MDTKRTREVVEKFFNNIGKGDLGAVLEALSPEVIFELPKNEWNSIIPYLGTHRGRDAVAEAFRVRGETTQVQNYEVRDLIAEDAKACAVIYTQAVHSQTKVAFDIEDSHHLTVNDHGEISYWKVYFDPNGEVAAFHTSEKNEFTPATETNPNIDLVQRFYQAYGAGDLDGIREVLAPNVMWHIPGRHPLAGPKRGPEEVAAFFEQLGESDFRADVFYLGADERRVVDVHRGYSNTAEGEEDLDMLWVLVYQIEDGRIVEVHNFPFDQAAADLFFRRRYGPHSSRNSIG